MIDIEDMTSCRLHGGRWLLGLVVNCLEWFTGFGWQVVGEVEEYWWKKDDGGGSEVIGELRFVLLVS